MHHAHNRCGGRGRAQANRRSRERGSGRGQCRHWVLGQTLTRETDVAPPVSEPTTVKLDRTDVGKLVAVINADVCVNCGICTSLCPEGAISMDMQSRVDPDLCSGCGVCVDGCPIQAISMTTPLKVT